MRAQAALIADVASAALVSTMPKRVSFSGASNSIRSPSRRTVQSVTPVTRVPAGVVSAWLAASLPVNVMLGAASAA